MGNISANPLKSLTFNEKKIVRIMTCSSYYAHTAPIFRDLEILTIDQLIVHRIGTVMYKFKLWTFTRCLKHNVQKKM